VLERVGMDVVAVEDDQAMAEVLATGVVPDLFILDMSLPGATAPRPGTATPAT
jgi:CheY-like chemotaxis protein